MLKAVNLIIILIVFLGCTKDKVPDFPFSNGEISFLLKKWKWRKSNVIVNFLGTNGGNYNELKADQNNIVSLEFFENGNLVVTQNSSVQRYMLYYFNHKQVGNNHLVRFSSDRGNLDFIYNEEIKLLSSCNTLFDVPRHECDQFHKVANNVFEVF